MQENARLTKPKIFTTGPLQKYLPTLVYIICPEKSTDFYVSAIQWGGKKNVFPTQGEDDLGQTILIGGL